MFGRAALVGLVAVAACGGSKQPDPVNPVVPFCPALHPTPLANIGPDLHLLVPCGGVTSGVVASVTELGNGVFNWSASIAGDPTLQLQNDSSPMCTKGNATQLASVVFTPPLSATPGDSFDAVVTISAGDVSPTVTVDRSSIDFGDVSLDDHPTEMLTFQNDTTAFIYVLAPASAPPFVFDQGRTGIARGTRSTERVAVFGDRPGDVATVGVFTTTTLPELLLPDGCTGTIRVDVHARLVAPDGGAGADGPSPMDSSADGE